jgi:hypothetical protein
MSDRSFRCHSFARSRLWLSRDRPPHGCRGTQVSGHKGVGLPSPARCAAARGWVELAAASRAGRPARLLDGGGHRLPAVGCRGTWRVTHRVGDRWAERSAGRGAAQVWAAILAGQEAP